MTTMKNDIDAIKESYPKLPTKIIIKLRQIAYKLQQLNLSYCNGKTTNEEKIESEKLEQEVIEIGKKYSVPIEINNDPRGFPIRILNTKKTNSFIREGWGMGIN